MGSASNRPGVCGSPSGLSQASCVFPILAPVSSWGYTACSKQEQVNLKSRSSSSLPEIATQVERLSLVITIGGVPIRVNTTDPDFLSMLQDRYAGFVSGSDSAEIEFDVELIPPSLHPTDAPVEAKQKHGIWSFRRGDFRAEWQPVSKRGWVQQTLNPYSIDSVLRIVHTLALAREDGF